MQFKRNSKRKIRNAFHIACFLLTLILVSVTGLSVTGQVSYGGDNTSNAGSGSATSGTITGTPISSSAITLIARILDTVAITIFDESGSPSNNWRFLGLTPTPSVFSTVAASNNAFIGNTPTTDLFINGAIFKNSFGNVQVRVTRSPNSGGSRMLHLMNGPDRVNCRFTGNIGGEPFRFNRNLRPTFNNNGIALISLVGDIRESSHTSSDDPGDYTGVMTITITAP